jgi:membrane protease YdiL (CAAX protease family)
VSYYDIVSDHYRYYRSLSPNNHYVVSENGIHQDITLGASQLLGLPLVSRNKKAELFTKAINNHNMSTWDKALLAVYAAESGDLTTGSILAKDVTGDVGATFQQIWNWNYRNIGSLPKSGLKDVQNALNNGCAASILEARWVQKAGGTYNVVEDRARNCVLVRILRLGIQYALLVAGIIFIILNLCRRHKNKTIILPLPYFAISRRKLIVTMSLFISTLAIFCYFPAIANYVPWIPSWFTSLQPLILTCLSYLSVAKYLCWANSIKLSQLFKTIFSGINASSVRIGIEIYTVTFIVANAVDFIPWIYDAPRVFRHLEVPFATTALHFIVGVILCPICEELVFRGALLNLLIRSNYLNGKFGMRFGYCMAVIISSFVFATVHPFEGFPTIFAIGVIFSSAYILSGNLVAVILAHSLWNAMCFFSILR